MLNSVNVKLPPASDKLILLDADVSPLDNSGSYKEGAERTYKDVDGYAPIFFYLDKKDYMINQELRTARRHPRAFATNASQCPTAHLGAFVNQAWCSSPTTVWIIFFFSER